MKRKLLFLLAVIFTCLGCEDDNPKPTETPWKVNMLMGNFSINSNDIITYEDGVSLDYLADYVNRSDLPASGLEVFTIYAYVPTGQYIETSVEDVRINLTQVNGGGSSSLEARVFPDGEKLIGVQNYAVFRLTGIYRGQTAITASNFANVTFEFLVEYKDSKENILETRDVTLEVFKIGGNDGGTDTGGGDTGGGSGSTTGGAMFWLQSDLGCGQVTVQIEGHGSGTITAFFSNGAPECGTEGSASFTLPAGTYSYSASCSNQTWSGTITVNSESCSAIQLTADAGGGGSGGGGTSNGQATFWTQSDLGCGNINVSINGYGTQTISAFHSGGDPNCGSSGTATFDLPAGTYSYSASCSNQTWSGNITVNEGSCSRMQLTGSGGGGSGGGDGGGGGSSTGQAMFWTNSDLGCGSISVTVSGYGSKTISAYYTDTPPCGSDGNATFNLPVGDHNYSATCSGYSWSGTISVTADGCSRMRLY